MNRQLKRWGTVVLIVVAVLAPTTLLARHWVNSSSTGNLHTGSPTRGIQPVASQPLTIKTSYFTTVLPAGFALKSKTETGTADPIQLRLMAYSGSSTDQQFGATIGTLPAAGISDIGDYNLRATDTTSYMSFVPPSLPAGATAFRSVSGPAAFVVFWPHGAHYAELALTSDGGSNLTQLQAAFASVMARWVWQ